MLKERSEFMTRGVEKLTLEAGKMLVPPKNANQILFPPPLKCQPHFNVTTPCSKYMTLKGSFDQKCTVSRCTTPYISNHVTSFFLYIPYCPVT